MREKEKDLSNIALSLAKGSFYSESRKKLLTEYIILVVFIAAFGVFAITMMSIEYVNDGDTDIGSLIGAIVAIVVGCSTIPIICGVILARNGKIRKNILIWLEDAVELNAYSRKIDMYYWCGVPIIKFQIEFVYNGLPYIRSSENEQRTLFDLGRPVGYFSKVLKYVDRQVDILYSPKYDQVLVLKN